MLIVLCTAAQCFALSWTVRSQPVRLLNGAPVLFRVKPTTELGSLTGTWLGHQLTFSYNRSSRTWLCLAGVSFETKPGANASEVECKSAKTKGYVMLRRIVSEALAH